MPFQRRGPSSLRLRALRFVAKAEKKLSWWKTERMETMLREEKLQGLRRTALTPRVKAVGPSLGGVRGLRAAGMAAQGRDGGRTLTLLSSGAPPMCAQHRGRLDGCVLSPGLWLNWAAGGGFGFPECGPWGGQPFF